LDLTPKLDDTCASSQFFSWETARTGKDYEIDLLAAAARARHSVILNGGARPELAR
jgi:hypothetical protein